MARATTSRGARSRERVLVDHEADAVLVAQDRALAAERLRQQRPRHARVVHRGRVELHELDVGHGHAGPQRHRDAVAGRHRRVRGHREQLARAAGGEHGVPGPQLERHAARRRARAPRRSGPSSTTRSTEKHRSRTSIEVERADGVGERALDLGAGRVAARVHDPRQGVPALDARARARRRAVSNSAPSSMSSRTRSRTLGHQHVHGVDVAQPRAGDERVGLVERGRVAARRAPPRPRPARTGWPRCASSPLVTTPTRGPARAARIAAERPAIPLPSTRRSITSAPGPPGRAARAPLGGRGVARSGRTPRSWRRSLRGAPRGGPSATRTPRSASTPPAPRRARRCR